VLREVMMVILLKMENINKSFSNVQVLHNVNIEVEKGEVHVLLGENGAGKSTIIKILTGAYTKDSGEIYFEGKKLDVKQPIDSMKAGIATIYQELNLVPQLSVAENIFLGHEEKKQIGPFLDRKKMNEVAEKLMKRLGQHINPSILVQELGVGKQQLVEIAKALSLNAKLIIMDEPTSSLSGQETEQLLSIIEELKKQGITFIYISHRLEEIKRIGDRVTILRDGQTIETLNVKSTSIDKMIELMVGRSLDNKYPKKAFKRGEEALRIEDLEINGFPSKISFTAYQGEILGISGLVGAGRTELLRGIFGADPIKGGKIYIYGKQVSIRNPQDAIKNGIAFITEDRKGEGLLLDQPAYLNMAITNLKGFKKYGLLSYKKMKEQSEKYFKELQIRPNNLEYLARNFSGGNQQKVVISKWLNTNAKIFFFDEPTRGIDVGAKIEVYNLINKLVEEGKCVIIVSSELPEILGMCDRILVMHEGKFTADLKAADANQEIIMKAATGG
jgi:ribose transport system ATP-binding protein